MGRQQNTSEAFIAHVPPSVEEALQEQAAEIWEAYYLGNKNDARLRFNVVLYRRRAYVIFWILEYAGRTNDKERAYDFICSVTV